MADKNLCPNHISEFNNVDKKIDKVYTRMTAIDLNLTEKISTVATKVATLEVNLINKISRRLSHKALIGALIILIPDRKSVV